MSMDAFASLCDRIASAAGRNRKLNLLADYFSALNDADLVRAVRFLSGDPLGGEARLSVGAAALRDAAVAATGWDLELIRFCSRVVGDSAETIALLMAGKTANQPLDLEAAEGRFRDLAAVRPKAARQKMLVDWLQCYRPLTLKYFLKVITGMLRIGLQSKLVEEAMARSTGAAAEEVRAASNRCGDLAAVALAARHGRLGEIEARLFHPMEFMLAKPLESMVEGTLEGGGWWVEDKFDGIRCQLHAERGKVKLFTRGLEDVTGSYPDLVLPLSAMNGGIVLDGELLAWKDGAPQPFNALQQRLARKKISAALLEQWPVAYMAYDLLYADGRLWLERPLEERRARLEQLRLRPPVYVSAQTRLESVSDLDLLFEASRRRRNEGLVLKRAGSLYEAGRRGGAWIKVKKAYATLDVVITAAEQGRGRRATMLSDYTFAVRDGDRFLNVGKAYSGLTDDEIRELTRLLKSLGGERFGRVLLVKPEVVLEVAFDGIQKSPRHKSGFAMRFPRIVRWRRDKTVEEIDSIERVRELYVASL